MKLVLFAFTPQKMMSYQNVSRVVFFVWGGGGWFLVWVLRGLEDYCFSCYN